MVLMAIGRRIRTPVFRTLIVDCPWSYSNYKGAEKGAASSAMTVQSEDWLEKLSPLIDSILAPKGLVIFWTTWPKLMDSREVIHAWGLEYVTGWPWVKTIPGNEIDTGIGHWSQSASEVVMILRRKGFKRKAKMVPPVMGLMEGETPIFYARKDRRHSTKPIGIHHYAETVGEGPYGELFARRFQPNWRCYGEEVGTWITPDGIRVLENPTAKMVLKGCPLVEVA